MNAPRYRRVESRVDAGQRWTPFMKVLERGNLRTRICCSETLWLCSAAAERRNVHELTVRILKGIPG